MARNSAQTGSEAPRSRSVRLGFRVDVKTKALVERAVRLSRRSLTDFCLSAVADAAQRTVAEHESLVLSADDRAAFFDVLMSPPRPNARLKRAMRAEKKLVAP